MLERQQAQVNLDYESFKRKVKASYGLDLGAYKQPQMERRLRANMDRCGAHSFVDYYNRMQRDPVLLDEFLDRVTINVSELFRNPEMFEVLRTKILPELSCKSRAISVWSAGCSYGAEPYTLAVLLDELNLKFGYSILATDIDDRMLARATRGVFTEPEMRNVAKHRLLKYFNRLTDGYEAKDNIKSRITFKKHNLLEERFGLGYDLIVCRNVVIYFTEQAKSGLYRKFYDSLKPGGYLFVGGTERVTDHLEIGYETPLPFFYRKPASN